MSTAVSSPRYSLYHYRACPFCAITRSALQNIDLEVTERDIQKNADYRSELIRSGGKAQVPCLKIEGDGGEQWLYESLDIIHYLKQQARASKRSA
jgi:glutaredoxin